MENIKRVVSRMPQESLKEKFDRQMRIRCIMQGCVYGIPGFDEKPKDHCIYCGEPAKEWKVWE